MDGREMQGGNENKYMFENEGVRPSFDILAESGPYFSPYPTSIDVSSWVASH